MFIYLLIAQIINLITPLDHILDPELEDINYLRFLFSTAFITGGIGSLIALVKRHINYVPFLKQNTREKMNYIVIAFFLSNFYLIALPQEFIRILTIATMTIIIAFILPTFITFYASIDTKKLWIMTQMDGPNKSSFSDIKTHLYSIVLHSISVAVILVALFTVTQIIRIYATGKIATENQLRTTLYIHSITPIKTTHAEKVTMKGYNFGWRGNDRSRLMSSDGQIPTHLWTNTDIEFEIPLHLREGTREIWVERPIDETEKSSPVITSNHKPIIIVSRFIFYPALNDSLGTKIIKRVRLYIHTHVQFIGQFLF